MLKSNGLKHAWLGVAITVTLAACGGGGTPGTTEPPTKVPPGSSTPGNNPPVTTPPAPTPPPPENPPTTPVPGNPKVTDILPSASSTGVMRNTAITAGLWLPTPGVGVDRSTLDGTVRLYETISGTRVPGNAGTDGAGGNITFQPLELLKANTQYTFEVTSGVKDENGRSFTPYKASFTTGTEPKPIPAAVNFAKQQVYPAASTAATEAPIASLTMNPDNSMLYGVTLDGKILRWRIASNGGLGATEVLALPELQGRPVIGIVFDPEDPNTLWISHSAPFSFEPGVYPPDFSGKISRLTLQEGPGFAAQLQDYVVGLPRSIKDHLTNSLTFGPDGMLYVTQGSNSSTGAADPTWVREERLLSGSVLRIDPRITANVPVNVQTADTPTPYDPFAPDAPVTIYSEGVRNAYDLVWHSNGYLYLPTNGGASGGYTPTDGSVPALKNAPTQKDFLFKTRKAGEYFGHPNPLQGHFVLNGGNPTANVDPAEVVTDAAGRLGYPVGVKPDPEYRRPTWDFGYNRSPNGVIEYKSGAFGKELQGKLLVVEYSTGQHILVLTPGSDGNITGAEYVGVNNKGTAEVFTKPLDLVEDPRNGNLYVVELWNEPSSNKPPSSRILLLKPS